MPTYEYKCAGCELQFEVTQKITEDALTTHLDGVTGRICGPCRRLLFATPSTWKGGSPTPKNYS